jgi:hypothetical protein
MPAPLPFHAWNLARMIGPGMVLAGGSIGTGEWVMGPQAAARYHGAMLWVVLVSILAQVVLNTEVMRYTLCTGEPMMTGFMRCKPGPKFWLWFYLLFDFGGWWPALASLAAQILVVAFQGLTPADPINQDMVRYVSYGVFLLCAALPLFGGKIYNTIQFVMGGKFLFTLFYLSLCCLFFVSARTWGELWGGLINPTRLPLNTAGQPEIDWTLISSLAGFAGVGGLGNIMASNFVREKGWGMGRIVGAIPSAFGGHQIALSHIGTMCEDTPQTLERFKGWQKYIAADQYLIWAFGSLIGMMLPCLLGAEYLQVQSLSGDERWRWAAALAQDFGAARGEIFRWLTLLCGLIILIPGQFYVVDNIARRWTDAVWSGLSSLQHLDAHRVKIIYYAFAGAYVVAGVAVLTFFPKLSGGTMMQIAGNMANLGITMTIFQTLYVNRRFLPQSMRPSLLKQGALILSGLFFLTMFGFVFQQKLLPLLLTLFGR